MVSSRSMSQLEQMGSELRCAICLSLFKNAATISCNHTFCRSCILESLRSATCCPVCKTHLTRREIRPSPQMDNLVEIFRGMETSSGVCLFPTQSATQPTHPCKGLIDEKSNQECKRKPKRTGALWKNPKGTTVSLDRRKRRRRGKSAYSESDDDSDVDESMRTQYGPVANAPGPTPPTGLVLAKKRVQVPQSSHFFLDLNSKSEDPERIEDEQDMNGDLPSEYRPSNSSRDPTHSETRDINSMPSLALDFRKLPAEVVSPHQHQDISQRLVELLRSGDNEEQDKPVDLNLELELQGFPSLRQAFNELPQLTPFFSIPNDAAPSQDELPTQIQLSAQPLRPTFSDLKESDDEGSLDGVQEPDKARERGLGEVEGYESDRFEWTQTPCSPELSCSPTRYGLQACSTKSFMNPHINETASKQGVEESIRTTPRSLQERPFGVPFNQETFRQRSKGASDKCTNSSSEPNDDSPPQIRSRRSSRARTSNHGASLATPGPVPVPRSRSQTETTSVVATGGITELITPMTELKRPTYNEGADCAAAANRFLNLLRDGPDEVALQPLAADTGITTPKVQVQGVSRMENPLYVEKTKAVPQADSHACRFCGRTGNSEVAGEMMEYQMGTVTNRCVHVHKLCAEWAPNVYFEVDDDCPKNLSTEITRGSRIKCTICGKKGAALGCCNNKCKNSYHYPCARLIQECQWNEDDYIMFCPQHGRGRVPKPRRQSRDSSNSTLETPLLEVPGVSVAPTHSRVDRRVSSAPDENTGLKWAAGPAHKWVLCVSGLDSRLKAEVASFASRVGATLVRDWSPGVTHVLTGTDEQGAAKRTLKYLLAILEGKWIVKTDWMNECITKKQPVPEEPYLVTCDVNGFFGGPCLSRHLSVTKAPKLFQGLSFYLCGDFTSPLKADLHSLVSAGGGTVLHRKPLPLPVSSYCELPAASLEPPRPGEIIVLYNGQDESRRVINLAQRIQEAMSVSIPAGALAIPCSWLLDSIAHCRLLPPN